MTGDAVVVGVEVLADVGALVAGTALEGDFEAGMGVVTLGAIVLVEAPTSVDEGVGVLAGTVAVVLWGELVAAPVEDAAVVRADVGA